MSGLYIESAGKVSITNSGAYDNTAYGIYVKNDYGTGSVIYQTTNKKYFITNNDGSGLYIVSYGAVTVKNKYGLEAGDNGADGVHIYNGGAVTPQRVTLSKVTANHNDANGITVYSDGSISATSLVANHNSIHGASLETTSTGLYIIVRGSNEFKDNDNVGLLVETDGYIIIEGTLAANNGEAGIDAHSGANKITLKYSTVRSNGYSGVKLVSDTETVYVYKVNSFANGFDPGSGSDNDGIYIDAGTDKLVTIKYGSFQANNGNGIHVNAPLADVYIYKTYYFGNGEKNINTL